MRASLSFCTHAVRLVLCAAVLAPTVVIAATAMETAPMLSLADFSRVKRAAASLVRDDAGIWYQVHTRALVPGDATTLWVCGWNDPSVCANGPGTCGADPADLDPSTRGFFCMWGAGGIVNKQGKLAVSGYTPAGGRQIGQVLFGKLKQPLSAELNLVVRTHGQASADVLFEQLVTFAGGCDVAECADVQVGVFAGQ